MMNENINDGTSNDESCTTETKNEVKTTDQPKNRKRSKEEKCKQEDVKNEEEQFLQTVDNMQTAEEKLSVMCKKYSEIVDENKKLILNFKQSEKKIKLLEQEKEHFRSQHNKALLARKQLENLCRELQKQSKAVKENCLVKLKLEETKRKYVSEGVQNTLATLNQHMKLSLEKNMKISNENIELNAMLQSAFNDVKLKEKEMTSDNAKLREGLFIALMDLDTASREAAEEKKAFLKEKQQLLLKLTEYQAQIEELQATEAALRSQINIYTEKYDEFQNSLIRSNKVCGEFNNDMEVMSKKIIALETETNLWKQRWEKRNADFLDITTVNKARETELAKLKKQVSLLEDLCRRFQEERTNMLAELNEKTEKKSQKKEVSKEKEEKSTKERASSKNSSDRVLMTNCSELAEQRLKLGSDQSATIEKKDEVNSKEKVPEEVLTVESSISSEATVTNTVDRNQESKDKDSIVSQEDGMQESCVKEESCTKEESSNVETLVEGTSLEKFNVEENVEKVSKEAIERVSGESHDNITKLESSTEDVASDNTVKTLIPENLHDEEKKEDENKAQVSDQEDKNEKLVDNLENKCTSLNIHETDSTSEEPTSNNLPEKDIPCELIEASENRMELNACEKSQETSIVIESIEVEKSESSQIFKDSSEPSPAVEKQIKSNNPAKEDNKSIKQTATSTTKSVRRKRK